MDSQTFATQIYLPSKDPRIRDLFKGSYGIPGPNIDFNTRTRQAVALANEGLVIDTNIDAQGQDCLDEMTRRLFNGYKRWPSLSQGTNVNPDGSRILDDPNFQILVSIDAKDYPPFSGPAPVVIRYVGDYIGNGMYQAINNAQAKFKAGDEYFENGFNYVFVAGVTQLNEFFWRFKGVNS